MIDREQRLMQTMPASCAAQQPARTAKANPNSLLPMLWQARGVRVRPALENSTGLATVQQFRGNRAALRMLAVERLTDECDHHLAEAGRSSAVESVGTPAASRPAQLLSDAAQLRPKRQGANATGLPDRLKAGVESLSALSMDDVRVHYNSPEPALVQALACARGTDIHLGPGQEKHLPHEVWHVVQQKQGRVRPTLQVGGMLINDDKELEREADVMGEAAARADRTVCDPSGGGVRPSLLSTASANRNKQPTTQLLTALTYLGKSRRTDNDIIDDMDHRRNLHTGTEKELAAQLSGYTNVAAAGAKKATICNHFIPYTSIKETIGDKLVYGVRNLKEAIAWMDKLPLPGKETYSVDLINGNGKISVTVGAIPKVTIPAVPQGNVNTFSEADLNKQVDDLITNLANDPRNLFYSPDSTGDYSGKAIDIPKVDDKYKERLRQYRSHLKDKMGLNV